MAEGQPGVDKQRDIGYTTVMPFKEYYTFSEACKLIGVSRQTLYRWRHKGNVKPVRLWGRTLLSMRQIRQLVLAHCVTCYHYHEPYCACRVVEDMVREPGKCTDWIFLYDFR